MATAKGGQSLEVEKGSFTTKDLERNCSVHIYCILSSDEVQFMQSAKPDEGRVVDLT